MTLTVISQSVVVVGFSDTALSAVANALTVGALTVPAGVTILVSNAALASSGAKGGVLPYTAAGTAAFAAVHTPSGDGGSATFKRGTASAANSF